MKYQPTVIETPTGKFIWVGRVDVKLADKVFNTKAEALAA